MIGSVAPLGSAGIQPPKVADVTPALPKVPPSGTFSPTRSPALIGSAEVNVCRVTPLGVSEGPVSSSV